MAAAATSRLLLLLLRRCQDPPTSLSFLRHVSFSSTAPSSRLNLLRPLPRPHPSRRVTPYSTSSAVLFDELAPSDSASAEGAAAEAHPWPEWEGFLEKLRGKGYFDKDGAAVAEGGDEGCLTRGSLASSSYYSRVKVACLGFARERPDLLRVLPKDDIQAVVGCGCPNLLRKSVNSAKRLREYVLLDEGDVCSSCNLRGSCDRAYVLAKKDEGARTVDIVRILLQYAAEPLHPNIGRNSQESGTVEESVRKLLSELIKLSDTKPDPNLFKDAPRPKTREEIPKVSKVQLSKYSQNAEMKKGDWICSQCNFMNYARNLQCLQCKADGPKKVTFESPEMKKGDWTCQQCQFMNFARNKTCRRCQQARPRRDLEPGEWECPSCTYLNFRRNNGCLKCKCDRPKDESSQYEDDLWRRPKSVTERKFK